MPPPPPEPPKSIYDDVPMPPEYSYPRHLGPEIDEQRRKIESNDWSRKTDSDYNIGPNPKALSKAAEQGMFLPFNSGPFTVSVFRHFSRLAFLLGHNC